MKKSLPLFLLLALMLAFTGCSDSGSSNKEATPEMKAAASSASQAALTAVGNAMGGASQGTLARTVQTMNIPAETIDNVTTSGTLTYDDVTGDMTMTLTAVFNNFNDGTVGLNGTLTVAGEIDGATYDMEMSETGTLTVTYEGVRYSMIFDILMEVSGDTASISGTITFDGEKYDIDESMS